MLDGMTRDFGNYPHNVYRTKYKHRVVTFDCYRHSRLIGTIHRIGTIRRVSLLRQVGTIRLIGSSRRISTNLHRTSTRSNNVRQGHSRGEEGGKQGRPGRGTTGQLSQ